MEHAGSDEQRRHVCDPSPPAHAHPGLTFHPRFAEAAAWLAAYTRTAPSTAGPPSAWTANECTLATCSCFDSPLCFGPDGECRGDPSAAGNSCDDTDDTTVNDVCDGAGNCTGTPKCAGVTCPGATDCLEASTCTPATGQCAAPAPKPIGTPCDDLDIRSTHDACDGAGSCAIQWVAEVTQLFDEPFPVPDTTPISVRWINVTAPSRVPQGQPFTVSGIVSRVVGEHCPGCFRQVNLQFNGACVQVRCDQRSRAGFSEMKPFSTTYTAPDVPGAHPVDVLSGLSYCPDPCGGYSIGSILSIIVPGTCTEACSEATTCLEAGICDTATGSCRPQSPKAAGTPCSDDGADVCDGAGTCAGTSKCAGVTCPSATDCLEASACTPATGQCSTPAPRSATTPCDDGDDATEDDACDGAGTCTGTAKCAGVTCPGGTDCLEASTCVSGQCSARAPRPVDTPCNDGQSTCDDLGQCPSSTSSSSSGRTVAVAVAGVLVAVIAAVLFLRRRRRGAGPAAPAAFGLVQNSGFDPHAATFAEGNAAPARLRATRASAAPTATYEEIEDTQGDAAAYEVPDPGQPALYEAQRRGGVKQHPQDPTGTCGYTSTRGDCRRRAVPHSRFCPSHTCPIDGCTASKRSTERTCGAHGANGGGNYSTPAAYAAAVEPPSDYAALAAYSSAQAAGGGHYGDTARYAAAMDGATLSSEVDA